MADWTSIKNEGTPEYEGNKNRRRHPRKKYTTGVTYSVMATPKGTGLLQDGEELPINATAKVIWCRSEENVYLVGVQFIE